MAAQEYQYIQDVLKEFYAPAIKNQLPKKSVLWAQIKKKTADVVGKRVVIPVILGFPESVGSRAANDYSIPTADKSTYDQAYIYMKRVYGRVGIDGFSIEAAKGKGGWVDPFTQEVENVGASFAIDIDRQTMMNGKGILAYCVGAAAGQVITVDTPGGIAADTPVTKWFRKGMVLDVIDQSDGGEHASDLVVSSIDASAGTITVTGTATSVADNNYIVKAGSYSATAANMGEFMGIDGIISDDDNPGSDFEGIARSTTTDWQALETASVGTLSEEKIQDHLDAIEGRTDGSAPDLALTTYALRNKLVSLVKDAYGSNLATTLELKAGWKAIKYVGGNVELPILAHPKCPTGYIYTIAQPHLKLYMLKNLMWDDKGGGVMKPVAGFDMYEAWFKIYGNLATDCSNAHGKMTGCTTT